MPEKDFKESAGNEKLAGRERLRREIAEYEALLEDELKPIKPSFVTEEAGKKETETEAAVKEQPIVHTEGRKELLQPDDSPPLPEEKVEEISVVSGEMAGESKLAVLEELVAQDRKSAITEGIESRGEIDEERRIFQQMLEEYIPRTRSVEVGEVFEVPVVAVRPNYVLVDLGGKAEALIDIEELCDEKGEVNVHVGDLVKVTITGWDETNEQVIVSHRLAREKEALDMILKAQAQHLPVQGKVVDLAKAGLIVNVNGIHCFLPASQVNTRRVDDLSQFLGQEITALVLEVDKGGKGIILSRRRLLEEEQEKRRAVLFSQLKPGDEISGKVKAVMDFGVFIDLDGIDGFVPRDEVSWDRGVQPGDYFKEGKQVKLRVIAIEPESGRITLSRKQLKGDPWAKIEENYPAGKVVRGEVVAITDFGAFVHITEGLTGLIHISDVSWTERVTNIGDYLSEGQRVRCVILGVDKERQRISLGLKQLSPDPWEDAKTNYPEGTKVKGKVRAVTDRGILVEVEEGVRGVIEAKDLSWEKRPTSPQKLFSRGDELEAVVIGYDDMKRRLLLGVKQLSEHPYDQYVRLHPVGSTVRGKVSSLTPFGAFISLAPGVEGLLHISQIDLKRVEEPKDVLHIGQPLYLKIVSIDHENRKIALSRREYLLEEERREIEQYLKSKTFGGIKLGEVLKKIKLQNKSKE